MSSGGAVIRDAVRHDWMCRQPKLDRQEQEEEKTRSFREKKGRAELWRASGGGRKRGEHGGEGGRGEVLGNLFCFQSSRRQRSRLRKRTRPPVLERFTELNVVKSVSRSKSLFHFLQPEAEFSYSSQFFPVRLQTKTAHLQLCVFLKMNFEATTHLHRLPTLLWTRGNSLLLLLRMSVFRALCPHILSCFPRCCTPTLLKEQSPFSL